MKAYDIALDENNKLEINLYGVDVVRNGKDCAYQFDYVETIPVNEESIKPWILDLRQKGFFSVSKIRTNDFMVDEGNLLYAYRSIFLPLGHKLLEKVYDEVNAYGICHIFIYITYVNVDTGKLFTLKVNDLGIYSENLKEELTTNGFKYIGDSYLGNHLDKMDLVSSKPLILNKGKKKSKKK